MAVDIIDSADIVVGDAVSNSECVITPSDLAPLREHIEAIVDGIGVLVDDERQEALNRVKEANLKLSRQGDPLGLTEGVLDDPCDDSNAPNAYRASKGDSFELVATTNVAGRDRSSEAWVAIPIVDRMFRDKSISEDCYLAAQKFRRDYIKGMAVAGLTARYQPRLDGSAGTPIAQQAAFRLDPADRRHHHHTMWANACKAIDDRFDCYWLERIVCEAYEIATEVPPTLADVGRAYMGYKSQQQAQSSGATVIKKALHRLARHYGFEKA